jgi:hypothetical protein
MRGRRGDGGWVRIELILFVLEGQVGIYSQKYHGVLDPIYWLQYLTRVSSSLKSANSSDWGTPFCTVSAGEEDVWLAMGEVVYIY